MQSLLPRACDAGGGSTMRHTATDYEQWSINELNSVNSQTSDAERDIVLSRASVFAQLAIAASWTEHWSQSDNGDRS